MRLSINLATRPYVELGPIFRNLRIAMGVLAVTALGLGIWLHILSAKAREQQKALDTIQAQTTKLRAERAGNEARMRLPQNATELQRSQFLNALFARKSFSWTAVLMDLEEVLPAGVQVSSIEPQITVNGDVNIRLRVAGDRDRAVELVRNLEKSKRFVAPRLLGESAQQQKENNRPGFGAPPVLPNGVEFEILSGYNPLQARVSEIKKSKDAAQKEVRP